MAAPPAGREFRWRRPGARSKSWRTRWNRKRRKIAPALKIVVTPWSEVPEEKYRLTLIFVLAAVGLVMSIACADAGGLLLSRAVQRQKEIAIRASLGAGLWRIVRQLLCESLVLAVMGSLAGIAAARALLQLLTKQLAALPIVLPHLQRVSLNGRVLAFNAVLCLLLAVVCAAWRPILLAVRTDLQAVMRGGQAAAGPRGSSRLFSTLIAVEAGLAFLLLVGSGLMIRSLVRLQQEDHGFRPDHVLTLRVPVGTLSQPRPTGKYDTRPRQMAYYREILERVKTVPGIKAVAIVNNMPLSGINSSIREFGLRRAGRQVRTHVRAYHQPAVLCRDGHPADRRTRLCGYRSDRRSQRGHHQRVPGPPALPGQEPAGREAPDRARRVQRSSAW